MEIMENVLLFDLLCYGGEEYNNLLKNMLCDEFYIMQDKWYGVLIKIMDNQKLIGFLAGNYNDNELLILELVYILPLYRGKGIFIETISNLNEDFSIFMPNKFLIMSLLKKGYAQKVNENIVKCDFKLCFRNEKGVCVFSNYYHLKKCGIISDDGVLSPLQYVDIKNFSADMYREMW